MSKCDKCPIAGACYGERHRWACKNAGRGESSRKALAALGEALAAAGAGAGDLTRAEPSYPSAAQQAASALGSAVQFAASGFALVDQAEFDRRRSICESCPSGRYVAAGDRCEVCGCYLAIKPWGKSERCPEGHW